MSLNHIASLPRTLVSLRDLGELKPEWHGILSPGYDDALIASFLQPQFLENADIYIEKYQNTSHWKGLLKSAQRFFQITNSAPLILDIGSGAGNSVFPLLELYPDATLVASDLSVPLLRFLKDFLEEHYPDRSCTIMQLNAEQMVFEEDQFDLVVGGATLHHLFRPDQTIRECYRILKPGGAAIFFEPFELGNQILALGFKHLVDLNRNPPDGGTPIDPEIMAFFAAMVYDFEVRKGSDKSATIYQHLDDKWLFTRRYFEEAARSAGFQWVVVAPLNPDESSLAPFSFQTEMLLQLGLRRDLASLPDWARRYLADLDRHFSVDLIPDLTIEGMIILEKKTPKIMLHTVQPEVPTRHLLEDYCRAGVNEVDGWLSEPTLLITRYIDELQKALLLQGAIGEIGVWRGKYLILLYLLARRNESVVAVDSFVHVVKDPDPAQALVDNVTKYAGNAHQLTLLSIDSCTLSPEDLMEHGHGKYRLFSIDGGHEMAPVFNDLRLVSTVLTDGGVICMDDFFNSGTPGVIEGAFRFLTGENNGRIVPFAYAANKMFLTTQSHYHFYYQAMQHFLYMHKERPEIQKTLEIRSYLAAANVKVELFDHEIISVL